MCCTTFTPESRERIPRLSDVGNLAADRTAAVQMVLAAADFASCGATGGTIGAFADASMAQAAAHEPLALKDRVAQHVTDDDMLTSDGQAGLVQLLVPVGANDCVSVRCTAVQPAAHR